MPKTYRRLVHRDDYTLTVAKYSPPLSRTDFKELRDVAEMADSVAEVSEVIFKRAGKRVLLVWLPRVIDGEGSYRQGYTKVEPGDYLVYDHGLGELMALSSNYLQQHYQEEEGS